MGLRGWSVGPRHGGAEEVGVGPRHGGTKENYRPLESGTVLFFLLRIFCACASGASTASCHSIELIFSCNNINCFKPKIDYDLINFNQKIDQLS